MVELPPLSAASPSPLAPATGLAVILPTWHDPDFIGPLLFGTLLKFGVFCILVMQAVVFFARQGHSLSDGRLFQLYVVFVVVFTTLQVALGIWHLYNTCVLLRPWAFLPHPWLEAVLNGIVVESVHGFFIFRCYKLSRSKRILGLIMVMVLAQVTAATVAAVYEAKAARLEEIRTTTFIVMLTTVTLDTVISITLFINLWRQRTGQPEVDAVILRIIRMTVESIVPCLICLILILISTWSLGKAPIGSLFPLTTPLVAPLYANALLTTLNSRPGLRRRLDSDRDNGQISIHENIQFHSSYHSQRESHPATGQVTDSVRRGSMSYDIALTNAVQLSSVGKSSFDQLSSKATPLLSDDDTLPDLFPEYPPTLSSTHARSSPFTQAQEQG